MSWFHDWYPLAARTMYKVYPGRPTELLDPYTEILYGCRHPGCGALKTKRIDAHWTLNEITERQYVPCP